MKVKKKAAARLLIRAEEIKQEIKEIDDELKGIRSKLLLAFDEYEDDELEYNNGESIFRAKLSDSSKIVYDFNAMKEKYDVPLLNAISDVRCEIDYNELKALFKESPKLKKVLKPLVQVKRELNEDKLNAAYGSGEITKEDLKGCYNVKKSQTIRTSRRDTE